MHRGQLEGQCLRQDQPPAWSALTVAAAVRKGQGQRSHQERHDSSQGETGYGS